MKKSYKKSGYKKSGYKKNKKNIRKTKKHKGGAADAIGNSMKSHNRSAYLKAKEEREKELQKLRTQELVKKQQQEYLKQLLLQKGKK